MWYHNPCPIRIVFTDGIIVLFFIIILITIIIIIIIIITDIIMAVYTLFLLQITKMFSSNYINQ